MYLLKSRTEVLHMFKSFHKTVDVQFEKKIKVLRSDNGGEYVSQEFHMYLNDSGIEFQTSCAYTLEQDGVAERKNRHLLEVTRALLFEMNVPKHFWSDAV